MCKIISQRHLPIRLSTVSLVKEIFLIMISLKLKKLTDIISWKIMILYTIRVFLSQRLAVL